MHTKASVVATPGLFYQKNDDENVSHRVRSYFSLIGPRQHIQDLLQLILPGLIVG